MLKDMNKFAVMVMGLSVLGLVSVAHAAPWNPDCPYGNSYEYCPNPGQGMVQSASWNQQGDQGYRYNNGYDCPRGGYGSGRGHHGGRHHNWW